MLTSLKRDGGRVGKVLNRNVPESWLQELRSDISTRTFHRMKEKAVPGHACQQLSPTVQIHRYLNCFQGFPGFCRFQPVSLQGLTRRVPRRCGQNPTVRLPQVCELLPARVFVQKPSRAPSASTHGPLLVSVATHPCSACPSASAWAHGCRPKCVCPAQHSLCRPSCLSQPHLSACLCSRTASAPEPRAPARGPA